MKRMGWFLQFLILIKSIPPALRSVKGAINSPDELVIVSKKTESRGAITSTSLFAMGCPVRESWTVPFNWKFICAKEETPINKKIRNRRIALFINL